MGLDAANAHPDEAVRPVCSQSGEGAAIGLRVPGACLRHDVHAVAAVGMPRTALGARRHQNPTQALR